MNITENIQRIMGGKSDIKSMAQKKNIEIPESVKIDRYAEYLGQNWPDATVRVTYDGTKVRGSTKKWNQKSETVSFRNLVLDTRDHLQLQLQNTQTYSYITIFNFVEPVNVVQIITVTATGIYQLKHNGVSRDITIQQNIKLTEGHKILVLVSALGIDPRMLGGINLTNIAIIDMTDIYGLGNEPTSASDERVRELIDYEKAHPEYNPGGLVYGYYKGIKLGEYDYIDNALNVLHIGGTSYILNDSQNWSIWSVYRYIDYGFRNKYERVASSVLPFLISSRLLVVTRDNNAIDQSISFLEDGSGLTICKSDIEYNTQSLNNYLSNNNIEIYYKLATPIEIDLS